MADVVWECVRPQDGTLMDDSACNASQKPASGHFQVGTCKQWFDREVSSTSGHGGRCFGSILGVRASQGNDLFFYGYGQASNDFCMGLNAGCCEERQLVGGGLQNVARSGTADPTVDWNASYVEDGKNYYSVSVRDHKAWVVEDYYNEYNPYQ